MAEEHPSAITGSVATVPFTAILADLEGGVTKGSRGAAVISGQAAVAFVAILAFIERIRTDGSRQAAVVGAAAAIPLGAGLAFSIEAVRRCRATVEVTVASVASVTVLANASDGTDWSLDCAVANIVA